MYKTVKLPVFFEINTFLPKLFECLSGSLPVGKFTAQMAQLVLICDILLSLL